MRSQKAVRSSGPVRIFSDERFRTLHLLNASGLRLLDPWSRVFLGIFKEWHVMEA